MNVYVLQIKLRNFPPWLLKHPLTNRSWKLAWAANTSMQCMRKNAWVCICPQTNSICPQTNNNLSQYKHYLSHKKRTIPTQELPQGDWPGVVELQGQIIPMFVVGRNHRLQGAGVVPPPVVTQVDHSVLAAAQLSAQFGLACPKHSEDGFPSTDISNYIYLADAFHQSDLQYPPLSTTECVFLTEQEAWLCGDILVATTTITLVCVFCQIYGL